MIIKNDCRCRAQSGGNGAERRPDCASAWTAACGKLRYCAWWNFSGCYPGREPRFCGSWTNQRQSDDRCVGNYSAAGGPAEAALAAAQALAKRPLPRPRCALPNPTGPISPNVAPTMASSRHAHISEWGAALRAVDLARDRFTAIELGCGWGCWMNNTGVAVRRAGRDVRLIGVEGDAVHIAFAHEATAANGVAPQNSRRIFRHCAVPASGEGRGDLGAGDGVELGADLAVARDLAHPEQGLAVASALASLQMALMRQKGRALHEERGKGRHREVAHVIACVPAPPRIRQGLTAAAQGCEETVLSGRLIWGRVSDPIGRFERPTF
jgi:hypothetical protein